MPSTSQEIILTSSPDGPITAYDPFSGATVARFAGSRSPRKGLTLLGKKLVVASHVSSDTGTGSIHLYNWWSNTAFHNLPVPEPVAPLAATPDGLYLFAGGLSGHIHTMSFPSGDIVQSFPAHNKPVSCLEINDDKSLLISGSDDGTIVVIPVYELVAASFNKNSILRRFVGHHGAVTAVTCGFGGSNCNIISSSLDCTCKIWNLMQPTPLSSISFPCPILGFVMDFTESEFYAAGCDGLVYKGALKVSTRQNLKQRRKISALREKHSGAIVSIGLVNGGRNLVTASEDGGVWIWDIEMGQVVNVVGEEIKSISALVVANGFDEFGSFQARMGGGVAEISGWGSGFSRRELQRPVAEVVEMEQRLNMVVQDRGRAINNLESAIGIYEKLLQLILKQAKRSKSKRSDGSTSDDDDDDDEKIEI